MKIIEEYCTGCGRCEIECHLKAIHKKDGNRYEIDESICDNCGDLLDVQCVRTCKENAIVKEGKNSGYEAVPVDETLRLRPDHLEWFIAIMGSRGNGKFPNSNKEYADFRVLISRLMLDPDLKVRLVHTFDDICVGCPSKQLPAHRKRLIWKDTVFFETMGIEPGTVMRLWDAIGLFEEKVTVKLLRELETVEFVISNYLEGVSHAIADREKAKGC